MIRRPGWLLVPLLWLAAVPAFAQEPTPLTGRVTSSSGTPIAGAEVTLQALDGFETRATADADGRFAFAAVTPGDYRIFAEAAGFSPAVQFLSVAPDQPALALTLPYVVRERVDVVGHASNVDRIPGSAHIIGPAEMERVKLATDDVHQMLRQIPGVNVQEEEGYGLRPNISIRGSGAERSSKITLMEDGVLIAPAPYAAPAAYYSPVAATMEALEVRKGSSQVKYGPITTGGVLNYVTTSIPSDFELRASASGGGDETRKLSASVGDAYERVGWLVEAFQFRNEGFKELDGGGDTGVELGNYLAKLKMNSRPTPTLYQELEVKIGRTEQVGDETYLGLTLADFIRTPFRRYAASQADLFESTHDQYQARYLLARRNWDLTTVAYRNEFHRAWYKLDSVLGTGLGDIVASPEDHAERMAILAGGDSVTNALTVRNNNRTYYGAGVQSVLGTSASTGRARHRIELGIRYHQDEEDRLQEDDGYQMVGGRMILTRKGAPGSQANRISGATAVAGFAADAISWGRWTASPGLRYEAIDFERADYARTDPDRTGQRTVLETRVNAVIPGVGLTFAASPAVTFLGGVHRGFAPPGPGAAEGTEVEHSVNYELGTRMQRRGLKTELIGFVNAYRNLLGRDTLSAGGTGEGDLFNGGGATVYGLETSATWIASHPAVTAVSFPLRVAYTFTHGEFRNSFDSQFEPWGSVQAGDELPYVARHQLYASVDADGAAWRTRLEGRYTGRMRTVAGQGVYLAGESTDPYVVLTLSGEYELREGASVVASVQNLTNNTYVVALHPAGARPGLPRLVQVGLRFALGR